MDILTTLIVGLIVGALAKLIMPGKDPGGFIITILLGVAGAFVAGWLGQALGWYAAGEGPGIIMSIIGAVILLAIYRMVIGRRGQPTRLNFSKSELTAYVEAGPSEPPWVEPPVVTLDVRAFVAPIGPVFLAVLGGGRLGDDGGAGLSRALAVRLHVVDVDHHVLGVAAADRPR